MGVLGVFQGVLGPLHGGILSCLGPCGGLRGPDPVLGPSGGDFMTSLFEVTEAVRGHFGVFQIHSISGQFWGISGPFQVHLGVVWGIWSHLEIFWWSFSGQFQVQTSGCFGAILGHIGAFLFWGCVGVHFGAISGLFRAFGGCLGLFGDI